MCGKDLQLSLAITSCQSGQSEEEDSVFPNDHENLLFPEHTKQEPICHNRS